MERQPFERAWQEAFQGKEKQPPTHIWNSLATRLAQADASRNRKRLLYLQWLAAASIVFACGVGWWSLRQNPSVPTVPVTPLAEGARPIDSATTSVADARESETLPKAVASAAGVSNGARAGSSTTPNSKGNTTTITSRAQRFQQRAKAFLAKAQQAVTTELPNNTAITDNGAAITRASEKSAAEAQPSDSTEPTIPVLAETPVIQPASEGEIVKKKTNAHPLWTSVGFAGGGFGTSSGSESGPAAATADFARMNGYAVETAAASKTQGLGTAFSFGLAVGKRVGNRWVVQTGLVYLQQTVDYRSNFLVGTGNNNGRVALAQSLTQSATSSFTFTPTSYPVRANLTYLSVPAVAGYVLLDRKFSVQLNAGVATDFLIQSAWQDRSGQFQENRTDEVRGVYRAVNWAALFNPEISYQLGTHYRFSLVPGIRYSLLPLYSKAMEDSFKPFIWDLGVRLRYQFQGTSRIPH